MSQCPSFLPVVGTKFICERSFIFLLRIITVAHRIHMDPCAIVRLKSHHDPSSLSLYPRLIGLPFQIQDSFCMVRRVPWRLLVAEMSCFPW